MFKKSTVFSLHFAPSLHFTLSLQSAFYTQSAFYPWSTVCSLQSAVRSLRFTLTGFIVGMKSNKDTRCKQTNCRPDYELDRVDSWCRF